MNTLELTAVVWVSSLFAGFLGALTGLGGAIVITPLLALAFGVDIRYAIGASLVSVIATSSGAAAAYVREGLSNIRIGMLLEIATTIGVVVGASLALRMQTGSIAVIFGIVLLYSAYASIRTPQQRAASDQPDRISAFFRLDSSYPTARGPKKYRVHNVPAGSALLVMAGIVSDLLGIGSGAVKVIAMDQAMHIPFKVSTTTSNFISELPRPRAPGCT